MSEQRENRPRRKERPSFIWPLILIVVGAVFLLSNLGIFGDDVFGNIWDLWPVLLVAIGLDGLFRRNEIAGPIFMITLGSIFLLNSIGIMGWESWDVLWRFWPLMLIAVGLEIMVGRRSLIISAVMVFVTVAILGSVLWFNGVRPVRGDRLVSETISQELGDIETAEISISPAVGKLDVYGLVDSGKLISGEASIGKVYANYNVSGTTGYFSVDSKSVMNFPGRRSWDWSLGVTNRIPLEMDLSMGAGDLDADLSGLELTRLGVSQGVGDLRVVLASEGEYRVDISQAIGSIVVEIPEDIGIRIEVSRAISNLDMPPGFDRDGDYYYSPGYDNANTKVILEINQAIGNILVRYSR